MTAHHSWSVPLERYQSVMEVWQEKYENDSHKHKDFSQ